MATGWTMIAARAVLDNRLAEYPHIQLHTADPGPAGTTAVATNNVRKTGIWTAATAAGDSASAQATHSNTMAWTAVAGTEDYTHVSGWSSVNAGAGTCGWTGLITADAVVVGNNFSLPAGAYILRQPCATA